MKKKKIKNSISKFYTFHLKKHWVKSVTKNFSALKHFLLNPLHISHLQEKNTHWEYHRSNQDSVHASWRGRTSTVLYHTSTLQAQLANCIKLWACLTYWDSWNPHTEKNLVVAFSLKDAPHWTLCYKTPIRELKASAPCFPHRALSYTGHLGHLPPSCVAAMLSPKKRNKFHSDLEASKQEKKKRHKSIDKDWSINTKKIMALLGKDYFCKCVYTFDIKHTNHEIKFSSLFRYARSIPYIL